MAEEMEVSPDDDDADPQRFEVDAEATMPSDVHRLADQKLSEKG